MLFKLILAFRTGSSECLAFAIDLHPLTNYRRVTAANFSIAEVKDCFSLGARLHVTFEPSLAHKLQLRLKLYFAAVNEGFRCKAFYLVHISCPAKP